MNSPNSQCHSVSDIAGDHLSTPNTLSARSVFRQFTPQNQNKLNFSNSPHHATSKSIGNYNNENTPSPIPNPFELDPEHLKHAIVTPGIFQKAVDSTPDTKSKPFQWDIEHQAVLEPTEFGDITEILERQHRGDQKVNQECAELSETFFKTEQIAPSPFNEPVQRVNLLSRIEEEKKSFRNASSQTDVHIPLAVDFNELLKRYKLSESQIEELNKGDSFSNSSLRRKLFAENDSDSSDLASGTTSPEKIRPLISHDCWSSPPLTELPSSSPVFGKSGSYYSVQDRCSFMLDGATNNSSPDVSPISSPTSLHPYMPQDSQHLPSHAEDYQQTLSAHKAKDEFYVSNRGLTTDTEGSDADDQTEGMSISQVDGDLQSNINNAIVEAVVRPSSTLIESMSCSVSEGIRTELMLGVNAAAAAHQTSQSFDAQSACDTGYQSQITNTYISETSSIPLVSSNMSPPKSSQTGGAEWQPPSSSTPNKTGKSSADNEGLHNSIWHPL